MIIMSENVLPHHHNDDERAEHLREQLEKTENFLASLSLRRMCHQYFGACQYDKSRRFTSFKPA